MSYILLIIVLALAIAGVLMFVFRDKKMTVVVPKGKTHIVRRPDKTISLFGKPDASSNIFTGVYRLGERDTVVELPQINAMCFNVEVKDVFTSAYWTNLSITDIKVDARAVCHIKELEKVFFPDVMNRLKSDIDAVVNTACLHVLLKELLQSGVSEVVAKDAILNKKAHFDLVGIEVLGFEVSNIRDTYGREIVKNMRTKIAGETPKKPTYPSLEEAIEPEIKKL
jgi:hypothetical protein